MTTLTKDEVRKLTSGQQDAFGILKIQRLRSREQLLERARGERSMWLGEGLLAGLTGGLAILSVAIPQLLPLAILAVGSEVAFYASRSKRRMDAMMELLDDDFKTGAEIEHADDLHVV